MPAVGRVGGEGNTASSGGREGVAGRGKEKLKRRVGSVTPDSSPNTHRTKQEECPDEKRKPAANERENQRIRNEGRREERKQREENYG